MADEFTYLHYNFGVLCFLGGARLPRVIAAHCGFELLRNCAAWWAPSAEGDVDTLAHLCGDTAAAALGWLSALAVDIWLP